jgi:acyl carrier protein
MSTNHHEGDTIMTEQDILAGLGEIIEEITDHPASEVALDKSFEELEIDSLTMVEVIASVEDKYDLKVSDEQLKDLTTVQDVVSFIGKNAGSSA